MFEIECLSGPEYVCTIVFRMACCVEKKRGAGGLIHTHLGASIINFFKIIFFKDKELRLNKAIENKNKIMKIFA